MAEATPTFTDANPVTCITGGNTETSCKIAVLTITDPSSTAVTLTVAGNTYTSGSTITLTARGSTCWTGAVTVTGLTANTEYTWAVTQGSNTDTGTLKTTPSANDDHSFFFGTCNLYPWTFPANRAWLAAGGWETIYSHAQSANVSGVALVDDTAYIDEYYLDDSANSGLKSSGYDSQLGPATQEDLDDYLIAYCATMGMLGATTPTVDHTSRNDRALYYPRETNRQWCRKNLPIWPQYGDHEFSNDDLGFETDVTAANGTITNARWNNYATKTDGIGKTAWDAFWGLVQPDFTGSLDTDANHWVTRVGCCTIAALDGISHATGHGGSLTTTGSPTAITQMYTANQLDDVLDGIDNNKSDFTFLCMNYGLRYPVSSFGSLTEFNSGTQHALFDHCVTEYQQLFTRNTDQSLMNINHTNGVSGCSVVLHGDYHRAHVYKYQKAAAGSQKDERWVEIGVGTMDGSPNFAISDANAISAAGQTKADIYCEYLSPDGAGYDGLGGDNNDFWSVRIDVSGSKPTREFTARLQDHDGADLWTGRWVRGAGNLPVSSTFAPKNPSISVSE